MAQSQLTQSITKAVTAALNNSTTTGTAMKNRSKRTTTQEPVVPTPVALSTAFDGPTPVDVAEIVKQVLVEMEPFIERTIKAAVATAIDAILPQLEKSVLVENERLTKTIGDLRSVIQSQAFDVDRLAQYSRRENVRLHGVPETAGENTDDVVIGIAHDMGVDISSNDISVSHRLPKSRTMKERPIIVKLVRRNTKTALMMNKKTLRTIDRYRHIYINDDLTPLRSRMLRTLQNDDEVKRVWTIDGNFNCVIVENNAEVKKRLETPDDLFKLGWSQEKMMDSGLFVLH